MTAHNLATDHPGSGPQTRLVGGDNLLNDHPRHDSHASGVVDHPLPADHSGGVPHVPYVGGHDLSGGHARGDATPGANRINAAGQSLASASASGHPLSDDHRTPSDQRTNVVADTPAADQGRADPHSQSVGGNSSNQPPTSEEPDPTRGASDGWLELRVWAEMFHDAQLARIAATNRAERGGVDPALYAAYLEALNNAEHVCGLQLRRCYRRVVPGPVRDWQKAENGIGDHLLARLLGHLGDPATASPHHWQGTGADRALYADAQYPRSLAQLWQYCGHGDPTRRIRKGMTADELAALGKPDLKMLVHLLAEACMKQKPGNTYRDVYEARRLVTAERVHATPCVRCGPSGKPAAEGSQWSKGHQHADALRIVGKELLRDLWLVAGGRALTIEEAA